MGLYNLYSVRLYQYNITLVRFIDSLMSMGEMNEFVRQEMCEKKYETC